MREYWKKEDPIEVVMKGEKILVEPLVYKKNTVKAVFFNPIKPGWARTLTRRVYIEDSEEERIYKYILLAKSSAKYIEEHIGIENIDVIDLQEAYTILLVLALRNFKNFRFITHIPRAMGSPVFPSRILKEKFNVETLPEENGKANLTILELQNSVKGVYSIKKT